MFGRGNWAIFAIDPESLTNFRKSIESPQAMLALSQLTAGAVTKVLKLDTAGINPFGAPRLDEKYDYIYESATLLADCQKQFFADAHAEVESTFTTEFAESAFACGAGNFALNGGADSKQFGFWVTFKSGKTVNDPPSIKEQLSYANYERPYKFLAATDKKNVDQATQVKAATTRKQCAVLLDFNEGRMYIESNNKGELLQVLPLLEQLKVNVHSTSWFFDGDANWAEKLVTAWHSDTHFASDFRKRAEDAAKYQLTGDMAEPIDDPEMSKIVSNFFAMAQTDSGLWAGLSTPAKVRLHPKMDAITVAAPVTATTLLGVTEDANVCAAQIVLQDRITYMRKGEEKNFRKDLLSFEVSGQLNLTEVGAALLRGFDMPAFRKDILREIRKSKQVPSVASFWRLWLLSMNDAVRTITSEVMDTLRITGEARKQSGVIHTGAEASDAVIEEAL